MKIHFSICSPGEKRPTMMMINPSSLSTDRSISKQIKINREQVLWSAMTVEQWSHLQRCRLIERLIPLCNSLQLDMLWTVLQPSLHRDYFYAVKSRYPNYQYKRISTPDSRASKEFYKKIFEREESFYLSGVNDLREFRDDDGLSKKSQSSIGRNSEEKSISIRFDRNRRSPIDVFRREKNNSSRRSVERREISSRFKPRTERSVTIRWTENSIPSVSAKSKQSSIELGQLIHWFLHNWSETEQNEFLRRMVVKFDERQQYFTSCVITQRHYRDFISLLPRKLSVEILSYLDLSELSLARQVCHYWKAIIDRHPDLWRPKETTMKTPEESLGRSVNWELVQKKRLTTKRNWLNGAAHLMKCSGHTERVLCICGNQMHLATGSLDRTIIIWTLKNGKMYQTLSGHSKGVWAVKFLSKSLLISGAYDCTLKIWNIHTSICLRTLVSHNGPVWSLACSNTLCLSGSQDRTARLWRLPKCELIGTLVGHTSSVFGVDLDQKNDICATASADKTVRIWSLTTFQCIKTLYATTDEYIMSVSLRHGHIAYAFGVHLIVYRITSNDSRHCLVQKLMETQEHRARIESVQLILLNELEDQPSLVSAGQDGLVKFWDFNNIASRHTYNTQSDNVVKINCIFVDETHIVTVGDDCLVKILDFTPKKENRE